MKNACLMLLTKKVLKKLWNMHKCTICTRQIGKINYRRENASFPTFRRRRRKVLHFSKCLWPLNFVSTSFVFELTQTNILKIFDVCKSGKTNLVCEITENLKNKATAFTVLSVRICWCFFVFSEQKRLFWLI